MNQKSSEWLEHVKQVMVKKRSGQFLAKDKLGEFVILEWEKATVKDIGYAKNMKEISPVACKAYTDVEVRFLKEFPDVLEKEAYYKEFKPLFKGGVENID